MNALLVILQILISCSGLPLLFIMGHRAWQGGQLPARLRFFAYLFLTLLMLVDTGLLAAYRIEELHLLMAQNASTALSVLDSVIRLKALAQVALVFLGLALFRQTSNMRFFAWWSLVPVGWGIAVLAQAFGVLALPTGEAFSWLSSLVPLLAWAGYCLSVWRRGHAGANARRAAKTGFILIAAFAGLESILSVVAVIAPQSLPVDSGIQLALLAFLVLNIGLYRGMLAQTRPEQDSGGAVPAPRASLAAAGLSPREQDVAARLARLASYKAIASELCISAETVKSHAKSVYRKTGCRDRLELMRRFELPG